MPAAYAIYDTETANLIGTFPTEEEALEMVWRAVQEDGPDSIEGWALGRTDHTGAVLTGAELLDRAKRAAA